MKVRIGLLLCFVLFSTSGFSQDVEKNQYWIIKFNPTHTIDFFTFPTVTLGAEKRISKSFGINFEVGNQFQDIKNKDIDTTYNKSKGFKTNIEGRWYWNKKSLKKSGFYNGLQLFFRQNEFSQSISYTHKDAAPNTKSYVDDFGVKKTVTGAMLVIGYQYIAPCHLVLEPYFGGGWMYRKNKNYHREFDADKDVEAVGPDQFVNVTSIDLSEARENTVTLTVGFRIGYQF